MKRFLELYRGPTVFCTTTKIYRTLSLLLLQYIKPFKVTFVVHGIYERLNLKCNRCINHYSIL